MRFLSCLLACSALIASPGCLVLHWDGIDGSGVSAVQERSLESFSHVKLSGVGSTKITVGGEQSVKITADDNLIDLIETEVEDGTLRIRPSESISPSDVGLTIEIVVPALTGVSASGATAVEVAGVSGDSFKIHCDGAASITAQGSIGNLTVSVSGAAHAKLRELVADSVKVTASGAANADVYASESLSANASGASDIECYGNPSKVDRKNSGVADVTLKGN